VIERAVGILLGDGGLDRLAADDAPQAHPGQQPLDAAARGLLAVSTQLAPDVAGAVDLEVVVPDAAYLTAQGLIALGARRAPLGIGHPHGVAVRRPRAIGRTLQIGSIP
jgi:hypothetical protein